MTDKHKISIDDLVHISKKLIPIYFLDNNIYSLISLAYMTISTYASKHRLTTQMRIDLTIEFLPDLLNKLFDNEEFDYYVYKKLNNELHQKFEELPMIIRNYIHLNKQSRDHLQHHKKEDSCIIS